MSSSKMSHFLERKDVGHQPVAPFIFLIVIIMGSLYGGWATPSEAAGVGSVAALFLVMAIYKLRLKDYKKIMHMTVKESTMILLIIAASFLFGPS